MKVLKDNYNHEEELQDESSYPKMKICEQCESELEYDESDLYIGEYGLAFIDCPLCGCNNVLYDEDGVTLTADNIQFPMHFSYISKESGAVDCCDNETVKGYIKKGINYLRKYKDETHYGGHMTGNLYVDIQKWKGDESYEVVVSNNFYCTHIPFEPEDYESEDFI